MDVDMNPWKRLGELLVAQRVALGWTRRAAFARDKGLPNDRILFDFENAKRTNYDAATYAVIEQTYGWGTGSVKAVLKGGLPVVLGAPVESKPVRPSADDDSYVDDRGPDDRSPGVTDAEVIALIERQRAELDELLEKMRGKGSSS